MQVINRQNYLDWLIAWQSKQIIKVVSGVRRCGKSTLFDIYKSYLISNGVLPEQIISINFEDVSYDWIDNYKNLYEHISSLLCDDKMNYIFLDEIQHIHKFEKAVDSLFIKPNCDVYITGSNAYFMSGELATLLSGRYVELKMLPLSFKEYHEAINTKIPNMTKIDTFDMYLSNSSFPYLLKYNLTGREISQYLRGIYDTVLIKDITNRYSINDVTNLDNITKFMMHNISNRVSATKIANTLKTAGHGVDVKTVTKYLRALTNSLMLYEVTRYNIKGKQYLSQQNKYYAVDIGLRNALVANKESDLGHILENIVYLELLRRGYDVYTGVYGELEIDFVTIKNGVNTYYQVSATTLDENTLKRELAPLKSISDSYSKYLITLDIINKEANYDGIQKVNIIDWLLDG